MPTVPWSDNLAALNGLNAVWRLSPPQRPYTQVENRAAPDEEVFVWVSGVACRRCGEPHEPIPVNRAGICQICSDSYWISPDDPIAVAAVAAAEEQEKAPGARLRRRGRR